MSEKKKSIVKVLGGLLALFGSAFGASEAGVMPDLGELERLGVLGSVLLIVYIEMRLIPLVMPGLKRIAEAPVPVEAAAFEIVEESPKRRAATSPGLKVVNPAREP
jgi:hypothetical protein